LSEERKNRITVEILGQQYVIIGKESPNHIRHVATTVDEKMKEIRNKNTFLDTNQLAVLTAVNAVNEYIKLKEKYDRLQERLNQLESDTNQ
jgi:cell division protein ZapA